MSSEVKKACLSLQASHSLCPKVEDSWCKFQTDKVTGEKSYLPVDKPLSPAVVDVIKPAFESTKLLQGCENCLTQNQNESLHHCVWKVGIP